LCGLTERSDPQICLSKSTVNCTFFNLASFIGCEDRAVENIHTMSKLRLNGVKYKVLRSSISHRGGGIEIDLSPTFENERMAVYQNYLGGGLAGSIASNDTLRQRGKPWIDEEIARVLDLIAEDLKKYFYEVLNDGMEGYEELQRRPISAY